MANLIDQMNILKGLDDQTLGTELNNPSGAVPPYLVMSEISRRKDMRQRYAGQLAQQKPATTVMQDQLASLAPPSGVAAGPGASMASGGVGSPPGVGAPMAAPMGINAAALAPPQTAYRQGGIVHYDTGGYVDPAMSAYGAVMDPDQSVDDTVNLPASAGVPTLAADGTTVLPPGYLQGIAATGAAMLPQPPVPLAPLPTDGGAATTIDSGTPVYAGTSMAAAAPGQSIPAAAGAVGSPYDDVVAGYKKQLDQDQHDRDQAKWLGLMQAGLAIAGGQSPYALTNIGQGGQVGLAAYQNYMKDANTGANSALSGLANIQQAKLQQQNEQFNQNISSQDLALKQQAAAAAADPNSPQNLPQAIREANYVNNMPESTPDEIAAKQAAMKIITPFAAQAAATKAGYAETIADGVHNGTIDPNMPGMYGTKPQVIAALAAKYPGDNLVQMQQQAAAANRNIQSMNSTQQLRLRQQIGELAGGNGQPGMLDKLQSVADDWNGSGLPPLNGVNLAAAKNGAYGEAGIEKATQFQAELADVTPALAGVFSSGNSPTDKALSNAQGIFQADTSKDAFDKLISLARQNLAYRQNALGQGPAGSADNRYNFSGGAATGAPAGATTPPAALPNVTWKVVSP